MLQVVCAHTAARLLLSKWLDNDEQRRSEVAVGTAISYSDFWHGVTAVHEVALLASAGWNLPPGHAVQAPSIAEDGTVLNCWPFPHVVTWCAVHSELPKEAYSPEAQLEQPSVWELPDGRNLPATQYVQVAWPTAEYFPAPQAAQLVLPVPENLPAGQL